MYDIDMENLPKHIAIILDGNRRWAKSQGLAPKEGHKEGSQNVKRITKFANKLGIKYLTTKDKETNSIYFHYILVQYHLGQGNAYTPLYHTIL